MRIETVLSIIINPPFWGTLIGGIMLFVQLRAFYRKEKIRITMTKEQHRHKHRN